jgi:hypothetical protein
LKGQPRLIGKGVINDGDWSPLRDALRKERVQQSDKVIDIEVTPP